MENHIWFKKIFPDLDSKHILYRDLRHKISWRYISDFKEKIVEKAIYHGLLHFYSKILHCDPLKKIIIATFTRRDAHNVEGIVIHSMIHLLLILINMPPLRYGALDLLNKEYAEL